MPSVDLGPVRGRLHPMTAMNPTTRLPRVALALVLSAAAAVAQPQDGRLAPLLDGLGDHTRPVTTSDPMAQRFFDQGLVLAFAFNHAEAARAFREAQRLDPSCAMCAWGEALVLGPHVNAPMMPEDVPTAWAALERAQNLAARATPVEQALIEALAARYGPEPVEDRAALDRAYADAMREVARRFPDDADVQSLFAEALMDTMPWDYWNDDGSPKPETEEVLAALERATALDPDHPMALHLWIHTVEKQRPELGVEAAERLGPLVPAAGHLVHMPAHIWIRVGRYYDSVLANLAAAAADDDYLAQCHAQGLYPIGYVPHNHHFLWVSAALAGMRETTLESASHMEHGMDTELMRQPGVEVLQHFYVSPLYAQALFGEWDEILATPAPEADLAYPTGIWRFARGLALARTDRPDEAQAELDALAAIAADPALDEMMIALNSMGSVLRIAVPYLTGEIAAARGDYDAAVAALEEAVRMEDALTYDEPPPWALPSRHALGAVLLEAGRPAEAEAVYRADLAVYPENGRALVGLMEALRAQGRDAEADALRPRFEQAWQHADVTLTASRF